MGTGLRPQRMPKEWEKRPLPMTQESPQGPSELRSARPAQGVFPSEVVDTLAASPGGFLTQIVAGRPGMERERAKPGDDTNVGGTGGIPGPNTGLSRQPTRGSASGHVTRGQF